MKRIASIPEKMKAVVCHGAYDYRYEEVPVPHINEDEVLVKIEACGICAGDVKSYQGAAMFWGGGILPPWNKTPVAAGHEFIGRVAAVGDNAAGKHNLKLGDRAIAEQIVPCQECRFCKNGERWMCEDAHIHGHQKAVAEGGMAEYLKYSVNDIVYKVSPELKAEHAAMIEPLSCSVHTVERAKIGFDDVVVIAGMGPIGLCKLQVARLKSPRLLIAVDMKKKRLDAAKKLGADIVLNPQECDVVEEVRRLTGGYGCDIYIHNSGHPSGVLQGLDMLRKHGTFVEFSVFGEETSVDWSVIGDRKELTIYGAHISGGTGYQTAIDFLEKGIVRVDDIVTHVFPMEDWKTAFDIAAKGEDSIKVVLVP